ncbi:hypothetical protein N657DRAFT_93810 [Parathielavia appendiculata]|uniref:Uncharacterized protein n=1 Tax=Parathielavia appendiculata TaxID=2587402 RepID=A0AAN6UBA5_9PEZI|nr:hypothetical protein N657DRAFT_93810 [Parathielavia appendiculata]
MSTTTTGATRICTPRRMCIRSGGRRGCTVAILLATCPRGVPRRGITGRIVRRGRVVGVLLLGLVGGRVDVVVQVQEVWALRVGVRAAAVVRMVVEEAAAAVGAAEAVGAVVAAVVDAVVSPEDCAVQGILDELCWLEAGYSLLAYNLASCPLAAADIRVLGNLAGAVLVDH